MPQSFFLVVLVMAISLSSACSSKRPRPEPAIYFSTYITVDGSKFFVYRQEIPQHTNRKKSGQSSHEMKGQRPSGGRGDGPQQERGRGRGPDRPDKNSLTQRVDMLIAENSYCRDGYIVLDEYTDAEGVSLRGECRDDATSEDRGRFRNPG